MKLKIILGVVLEKMVIQRGNCSSSGEHNMNTTVEKIIQFLKIKVKYCTDKRILQIIMIKHLQQSEETNSFVENQGSITYIYTFTV